MTGQSKAIVNVVGAAVETFSNQIMSLDKNSAQRRSKLEGKVISITPSPFPQLFFIVSKDQIDVLSQFEAQADCELKFSPSLLLALAKRESVSDLLKSEQLEVEGDIKVAQKFADLFLEMEADIEGRLASYFGDVIAYQVLRNLRLLVQAIKQMAKSSPQRLSQISAQEWQLHLPYEAFNYFKRDLEELESELDALELRIRDLEA
ncbi:hypothetical protein DBZ36_19810 [Alginatibacterium sediminis]|uniref:Ubiquinone biosynthesis accessory factor UbiJ n=1 Tax=Alginatibacterium sediminis TaxID=2164068 RepID=A0A420E6I0_9ALTE|nr:SCP2 sterol-binding domain-containing protein [Alginatibacterium sediminis]RKF13306.1 hypothetical protein DBZ36_19810 [Alginatibacterium sediminis]